MDNKALKYKIEEKNKFADYVFNFIFSSLGIKGKETDNYDEADIYYGNKEISSFNGVKIFKNRADIIWKELIEGKINAPAGDKNIPFDIINAIGFFLNDSGNKNLTRESYDEHNRLIFKNSFQNRCGIADFPIVNLYVEFLESLFEKKFLIKGLPLWPEGKKCAIGLSHDVDSPCKYAALNAPLWVKNLSLRTNLRNNIARFKYFIKFLKDKNPDDYWLFEEIMDEEEKFGFKSTFFFACVNQFDGRGSEFDVLYDIKTPKFTGVFEKIKKRGFEIGLHCSYNAYLDAKNFVFEKRKLEEISGCEAAGARHHYWHTGVNAEKSLRMQERAGFKYDSSAAFNDEIGFRRSVALPYYPWDEENNSSIKVLQLPVFCMDAALFKDFKNAEEAFKRARIYIEIIKKLRGIAVINWHVRSSFPKNLEYRDWGETYIKILEYLSADEEIWTSNLGAICSWTLERERSLSK